MFNSNSCNHRTLSLYNTYVHPLRTGIPDNTLWEPLIHILEVGNVHDNLHRLSFARIERKFPEIFASFRLLVPKLNPFEMRSLT